MRGQNTVVVEVLNRIGDLMELRGDEAYKVRAYREAARQLDLVDEDIATLREQQLLTTVRGVGPSIARTVEEILDTGESRLLRQLHQEVPESLVQLLGIRHFGPSRIVKAHRALGITSLDELEAAAHDGRLAAIPGFGATSVANLLVSIAQFRERQGLVPRYVADAVARTLVHSLRQMANVAEVDVAGGLRRLCESVRTIDLVAAGDTAEVLDAFSRLPAVHDVDVKDGWRAHARTREGYDVALHVVPAALWAQGLLYFTGSDEHVRLLCELARDRGFRVAGGNDVQRHWPGFLHEPSGRPIEAADESAVYRSLGLPWLPPELREGRDEVARALAGTLPRLISLEDVRGDLHIHTRWSDGRHTIAEMARRARDLGLHYVAIADHSPSLAVAKGLSLDRLAAQRREIAEADAAIDGIRILSGVEVDIKSDGSLDYADETLAEFDFVTASLHSGFQQPGDRLTRRVIAAMRSPHVDAIGHLTGRVLGWRNGLDLDVQQILEVAAETGTAMEINAWPNRLDLCEEHARRAADLGVKLVINSDSHDADQLEYLHYGVEVARRAWLEAGDVMNTLPLDKLIAYLDSRPHKRSNA